MEEPLTAVHGRDRSMFADGLVVCTKQTLRMPQICQADPNLCCNYVGNDVITDGQNGSENLCFVNGGEEP